MLVDTNPLESCMFVAYNSDDDDNDQLLYQDVIFLSTLFFIFFNVVFKNTALITYWGIL